MAVLSRLQRAAAMVALGLASSATAGDWELSLDVRAVGSDGQRSYLDNGQGKLRFSEDEQGLRLGRLRLAWHQTLGELFSIHVDASTWDDDDKNPIDLTEAYVEYRPYPRAGFRTRARLGAFFPPTSLESRGAGWETPYTITPSAMDSWMAEEIRSIGLETQVDWLGTRMGHAFDVQVTGAVFGWNDPAGTMLAQHGFALSDRQTTLFGRVGTPQSDPARTRKELFDEIDGRAGFYVGAQLRYLDRAVLNLLHYDNRADSAAPALRDFAWETSFDVASLRVETGSAWTLILQALDGETNVTPRGVLLRREFGARSALLARGLGAHRLALRYDRFEVDFTTDPAAPRDEDGSAWALAWTYLHGDKWRFALEWLRVDSDVEARPSRVGEPVNAIESKVELSARYTLGGAR